MRAKKHFAGWVCLLAVAIAAQAADPEQSLRETVQRFYQAILQSKWKEAERYVDPESREMFRAKPPTGFYTFQFRKAEFQKEGKEALVTVAVEMPVAQVGGQVLTLEAMTIWRLSKGKWYMAVSPPPPLPTMPRGPLSSARTSGKPITELQFDRTEYDFGEKRQGDRIEIEFPFVNVSDHPVRVTASLVSECNCMEVRVSKETVNPGERASVQFILNSEPFSFYYHQGIGVKVEPGEGNAILDITGFLLPASENPPKQQAPGNP